MNLFGMLLALGNIPVGWASQILDICTIVPLFTLTPRFVMNIRELHAFDTEGRWRGDIYTGFGLSSRGRSVGASTTIGTIAFAQEGEIEGVESEGEIAVAENGVENTGRVV